MINLKHPNVIIKENENNPYIFFSGPSHGWLKVPYSHIKTIKFKVSRYSYFDGEHLYLEEDCDAPAFCKEFEGLTGIKPKETYQNINDESFIRRLSRC